MSVSNNPLTVGLSWHNGVCVDSGTFTAYQAVKLNGENIYTPCATTDTDASVAGICLADRTPGHPLRIPVCLDSTAHLIPILSDGSAVATAGSSSLGFMTLSSTSAGRFTPGPTGLFRVVKGAAAVADSIVYVTLNTTSLGSGGATTGNWTFSGNNADLAAAGAMGLGTTNATSLRLFPNSVQFTTGTTLGAASVGLTNTTGLTLAPNIADGASSIGTVVNTGTALANATAKILSFQNNNVEKAYVLANGDIVSAGANGFRTSAGTGYLNAAALKGIVVDVASAAVAVFGGNLVPFTDLSFTHGDSSHRWAEIYTRHLVGGQTAVPGIAAGTGAGGGPTVSMAAGSTDTAGVINVTTGTSPTGGNAIVATITFNTAYGAAPFVILTPASANTDALGATAFVFVDRASTTTAVFVLKSGAIGLTAFTAYQWHYHVIG